MQRGFHGEAAVVGWDILDASNTAITMTTQLMSAPLQLRRELRIDGPSLTVVDTIRNSSELPVPVMWVQHPGFGAPFVDERCVLRTGASTFVADADAPGNACAADAISPFFSVAMADGTSGDLSMVPAPGSGRDLFGCLIDVEDAWFAIDSPTAGFGIRVEWDRRVFPHAWVWQECNANSGFPWYGRAYVIAIEPANVIPGDPSPNLDRRGVTPLLGACETWTSVMTLTRIPMFGGT